MNKFRKVVLLLIALGSTYMIIERYIMINSYSDNWGHSEGVFGYPISIEWLYLMLSYWIVWGIGAILIFIKKSIGWLFLMPVSFMGALYACVGVLKERGGDHFGYILLFIVFAGVIFIICHKTTLEMLNITAKGKYYAIAAIIFLAFGGLFLVIDKHA